MRKLTDRRKDRRKDRQKDGQKDVQTLFYRTLLAKARGPIKGQGISNYAIERIYNKSYVQFDDV